MKQLIFIYSAKSGFLADVGGAVSKALTGGSLCALCNITYGVVNEKSAWSTFVEGLEKKPVYYHRDDIPADVQAVLDQDGIELPVVLQKEKEGYAVIVDAVALKACDGKPECLIDLLTH